jgi:hypothetical protein
VKTADSTAHYLTAITSSLTTIIAKQYVTSNQEMQQCMPPLIEQQITYRQQAPVFFHYIPSNNILPPSPLRNHPIVMSAPVPTIMSNQIAQTSTR